MKNNTTISLYWKCQLIGWSLAAFYWQLTGIIYGRYDIFFGVTQFITDVAIYILLTHAYRIFALHSHWTTLNIKELVIKIIPAIGIMGVLYSFVTIFKIYLLRFIFKQLHGQSLIELITQNGIDILMGGIRLMSIWLLAYHLYHYAQREIRLAKLNAQLELLSKEAQLENLSAQLNPHFLFNALNTIKFLVVEKPEIARRAIDLLAELLRNGLYENDSSLVSIKSELSMVRDYLELESLRLEERLTICIDVDETLDDFEIPRFSIQILIENAIKHGISGQKSGGFVKLTIAKQYAYACITVANSGAISFRENDGIGLKNLRERLNLVYGNRARFEMSDLFNGEVQCKISISLV